MEIREVDPTSSVEAGGLFPSIGMGLRFESCIQRTSCFIDWVATEICETDPNTVEAGELFSSMANFYTLLAPQPWIFKSPDPDLSVFFSTPSWICTLDNPAFWLDESLF